MFSFLLVTREWNRFVSLHIKFEDERDARVSASGYLTSVVEVASTAVAES